MPDYSDLLPDVNNDQANRLITDALKSQSYSGVDGENKGSAGKDLWPYALGATIPAIAKGAGALASKIAGSSAFKAMLPSVLATSKKYPITAYHSSPHSFDQFDVSKLGTGEGAQSYGHGLYLAENPLVSGRGGEYDKKFTGKNLGMNLDGTTHGLILGLLRDRNPDEALSYLMSRGIPENQASKMMDQVNKAKSHIYEVGVKAEPHQFLRWDQPLRSSSPEVQSKIAEGMKEWRKMPFQKTFNAPTDENLLDRYGDQIYNHVAPYPEEATSRLLKAGIPGIRYLDQGSRNKNIFPIKSSGNWELVNAGKNEWPSPYSYSNFADAQKEAQELEAAAKPTYNYVVFNDKLMDILKKYGIAAPASAAALKALNSNNQDNSQ